MKVSYCFYELNPHYKKPYTRKGALLRIDFKDGSRGYADCHPWEELGDAPLGDQLVLLKRGVTTPLTHRSLYFARIDAEARKRGISLFKSLKIPPSHFLVTDFDHMKIETVMETVSKGFSRIKIKMRGQSQEIIKLKKLAKEIYLTGCLIRLDFNHKLTADEFAEFCDELGEDLKMIDFCEDPFYFEPHSWNWFQEKYRLVLACDHHSHHYFKEAHATQAFVLKPAVQDERTFRHLNNRVIVTSYLDHPLGQATAAYVAAKFENRTEVCGLISHLCYIQNEFSEQFVLEGPFLRAPQGTGFGFDEQLMRQAWKEI